MILWKNNNKSASFNSGYYSTWLLNLSFLTFPFIMFFWLTPFVTDQTIGKDYVRYAIHHQMELMFSIKLNSFPLYVPGFAGGQSSSALSLGQIFHPISYLSVAMPGYWDGLALEWNTFFRLLSLGCTHLILFKFISRLQTNRLFALLLSTITIYNLRMLDLFRYGSSLESWTGHLLLCTAIGFYWLDRKKHTWPLIAITGSTYWLVCSGHPQMMYYGLFGSGLFTLIFPYYSKILIHDNDSDIKSVLNFYTSVFIFCTIGICLSSASFFPYYFDFIRNNTERIGKGYMWAIDLNDTLSGTLNNFLSPLRSDVHGAFGGSSLILAAILIPILLFLKIKIPSVIWVIYSIILIAFLHMQGDRTPTHFLFWKFIPFASSFRIAGRIALIIPFFLMMLLVWLTRLDTINYRYNDKVVEMRPYCWISLIAILMLCVYCVIPVSLFSPPTEYSPVMFRNIPIHMQLFGVGLGICSFTAFGLYGVLKGRKFTIGFLIIFLTTIQIMLYIQSGTWIEKKQRTPMFSELMALKKNSLDYYLMIGYGLSSSVVLRQVERAFLEPFLGKIYHEYIIVSSNDDAYNRMATEWSPHQVIVESMTPVDPSIKKIKGPDNKPDHVKLVYSSFNRLVFEVTTSYPGFFSLSYPYSGNWNVFVNNQRTPVYRANGAAHAAWIPTGKSRVDFFYESDAAWWGMCISCATLTLLGFIIGVKIKKKSLCISVASIFLLSGVGLFYLWHNSLHHGKNIGTRYEWTALPLSDQDNIAYGKQTKMSSQLFNNKYPYLNSSGRAVDNDRKPRSGFTTSQQQNPWWEIDLHKNRKIGSIVIYEGINDPDFNKRPIEIYLSQDGKTWRKEDITFLDRESTSPMKLLFNDDTFGRFIRIAANGYCYLSFDEIEVFPYKKATFINPKNH